MKLLIKQAYFNIDFKWLIFLNDSFHDLLTIKKERGVPNVTLADNSHQHMKKAAILHILKRKNQRISWLSGAVTALHLHGLFSFSPSISHPHIRLIYKCQTVYWWKMMGIKASEYESDPGIKWSTCQREERADFHVCINTALIICRKSRAFTQAGTSFQCLIFNINIEYLKS